MKLSEAILLGDSLKRPNPNLFISQDGSCGCAFGGALLAAGATAKEYYGEMMDQDKSTIEMSCVRSRWPWLTNAILGEISFRYDDVCAGAATLESLVDYVRSVEPSEIELTETAQPENGAVTV